ncbi:MAG: group 1 glycosyl transferase [Sulfurimonas sp. RIFOXYD12_FULL_33_39]|uniref:glycosyltransferase n=1 Tax=unclassified Sulfurimonas TaxID=2623549 RepID=UPI0008C5C719|nr:MULTISPECIES: glycosyltransferase [unclassified Sulfurimonas]OHE10576.1 MAG: group 1 glycosyl transferase [Sulfurimonas sp. RIFOXYD12_FULL_33_39]OHE15035.1 MAG: group 1 glycosyl transferase [Sulfurimonas sp. RIFOXYD2_FULL_34_21]
MSKIALHQFSPSAHVGDGITNGMVYLQKILQELGFISYIYAQDYDKELEGKVLSYKKIDNKNKNQILFVHYSIYYDFSLWLDKLDIQKHMIYHNITPAEFFKDNPFLYDMCKKGREILPELKNKFVGYISDSALNSSELTELGYEYVRTIPLLIDLDKKTSNKWDNNYFDKISKDFNIIFVGRVAPNKAQHDLIEVTKYYKTYNLDFKLYIIGGATDVSYEASLKKKILENELTQNVILTGKISDEKLYAHYRAADVFLCMSEHEGFGIPLVEAMLFGVPVIAFNSSNIKSTLNGGGILFNEKNHDYIAAAINLIRDNRAFRRSILKSQQEAIKIYMHENILKMLIKYLLDFDITSDYKLTQTKINPYYQIEGPFDSSYSLSILNREMAKALEKIEPDSVSLFSTEGYGDFEPDKTFLKEYPFYEKLSKRGKKAQRTEVVLRNLYPPRVYDAKGLINLMNSYGWEESSFPKEYLHDFNTYLDALPVMSAYVKKVMIDNGLSIPVFVVGVGVDHLLDISEKEYMLTTKKSFKFLHVSSCFPRKGIDILLKSYENAFTDKDDVCLVVKTFPNPHNDIEKLLKTHKLKNPRFPEVELINLDLNDSHIVSLYKKCDTLVAPSRGEGFGLPMAEAMLFDMPVITTGFGGQRDFCDDETAWLIDYTFSKADTHMNLFNSYWAEPSYEHLSKLLKEVYKTPKEQLSKKTQKARENILAKYKWKDCALRILDVISKIKKTPVFHDKKIKLGWISTYNTRCGIATYTEFLLEHFDKDIFDIKIFANHSHDIVDNEKEPKFIRCWRDRNDNDIDALKEHVLQNNIESIVINFNFAFFSMKNLQELLEYLYESDIRTLVIFHSIKDVKIKGLESSLGWIKETLRKADRLMVHNIEDLNILKSFDIVDNVTLFPHGVQKRTNEINYTKENKVIASYGFMLPHKGIKELIEAFSIVKRKYKNIELLLVNAIYPNPVSDDYAHECKELVKKLSLSKNVTMINDFLSDDDSFSYLDTADMLIMPYRDTQESASGAIRYALSTNKPVICTPISIFNDVCDIVHFTKDLSVKSMAQKIEELLEDEQELISKNDIQKSWIDEHDWVRISKRLQNIIKSVDL